MSFQEGVTYCANCGDSEEEHCQTCWSCPHDPLKECCMEGWPEALKESERQRWANKAAPAEPAAPTHVTESDDVKES